MAKTTSAYQFNITDKSGEVWNITLQDQRLGTSAGYWNAAYTAVSATSGTWNKAISGVKLGNTAATVTDRVATIPSATTDAYGVVRLTTNADGKITQINGTTINDVDTGITGFSAAGTSILTDRNVNILLASDTVTGVNYFKYDSDSTCISAINGKAVGAYPTITDNSGVVTFTF